MSAADQLVTLTIDGQAVTVPAGTTVWEAARRLGIAVPVLCHDPEMDPVGVRRICAVEVEGARVLAAACIRPAENGMVVRTSSERALAARRMVTELLLADHPSPCEKQRQWGSCDLENLAADLGIAAPRFPAVR